MSFWKLATVEDIWCKLARLHKLTFGHKISELKHSGMEFKQLGGLSIHQFLFEFPWRFPKIYFKTNIWCHCNTLYKQVMLPTQQRWLTLACLQC